MAELKTKPTGASVEAFLNSLPNEQTRQDCFEIVKIMQRATQEEARMWGSSIVGFGSLHLKYASGRELDWMIVGFSPRKQNLTLYLPGSPADYTAQLERLGKHKTGGGCIYIKALKDVDQGVLEELIQRSIPMAAQWAAQMAAQRAAQTLSPVEKNG